MKAFLQRSLSDATAGKSVPNPAEKAMTRGDFAVALARAYRARLYLP